ncbi:hypothetical protein [Candidatus Frankia nodulisporulans]|nr:hypothetical protein [Candidatus Frankia nodulisporulans]
MLPTLPATVPGQMPAQPPAPPYGCPPDSLRVSAPMPPPARQVADLVVVVAAGGGAGRSTAADLLARELCPDGALMLIDEAPGLFSQRRLLPRGHDGLARLDDRGAAYWVLAPDAPMHRIDAVTAVAEYEAWRTVIVDTWDPALYLLHNPRWHRLLTEYGVRVLLVANSATGPLEHALTAARALRQAGVAGVDLVAAVVDTGEGRVPRRTLARITALEGECAAVTRVPFLPPVRTHGRLAPGQGGRAAQRAAIAIADSLALKEAA